MLFDSIPGRVPALEQRVEALEKRVLLLEGLLTPEQHAQLKLIKQAERIVEIARAEGMLPPL
jgi:hypothetical protein